MGRKREWLTSVRLTSCEEKTLISKEARVGITSLFLENLFYSPTQVSFLFSAHNLCLRLSQLLFIKKKTPIRPNVFPSASAVFIVSII